MNETRILSTHGNVIAAEFRPRASLDIQIGFTGSIVYCDHLIMVARYEFELGGKHAGTYHLMADLATGAIAQL